MPTVNDLVVVIPGIMGSSLVDRDGHEVWGLSRGGAVQALLSFGGSVKALGLPDQHGDQPAPDGVTAGRALGSFHAIPGVWTPITGYDTLIDFLRDTVGLMDATDDEPGNLLVFPYDWRLSNRYTALRLKSVVEPALERWRGSAAERADGQLVFVCHSMGGLVARWYLEMEGGAEITRLLITMGTPFRGAFNSVDQLVNGISKGIGPLRMNLTDMARSLPSSYQLLPEYACIEGAGPKDLLKTTEVQFEELDAETVADAMAFHDTINSAAAARTDHMYEAVPFVGTRQPTRTTGRLTSDGVEVLRTIENKHDAGDGTVPRLSARPREMGERDTAIRGLADGHGKLQANRSVLEQIELLITATTRDYRGREGEEPSLEIDDLYLAGEPIVARVSFPEERLLEVLAIDERGQEQASALVRNVEQDHDDHEFVGTATLEALSPGGYTILARAPGDEAGFDVAPAGRTTMVMEGV